MARLFLIALAVTVVGCSDAYQIAPVSGTITLDGKPLPGAVIGFEPVRKADDALEAGYGSYGKTDDQGHFTLKSLKGEEGAIVGGHRVSISTVVGEEGPNGEMLNLTKEKVPSRYNDDTELTFEVPPGGTDQANFDLVGK